MASKIYIVGIVFSSLVIVGCLSYIVGQVLRRRSRVQQRRRRVLREQIEHNVRVTESLGPAAPKTARCSDEVRVATKAGHFNKNLPGNVVVHTNDTSLSVKGADWTQYLSRGDPVKIGAQLFVVSLTGTFEHTRGVTKVPLDGVLRGPTAEHVNAYTCHYVAGQGHDWIGPSQGFIGYRRGDGDWTPGKPPPSHSWYNATFVDECGLPPSTRAKG